MRNDIVKLKALMTAACVETFEVIKTSPICDKQILFRIN